MAKTNNQISNTKDLIKQLESLPKNLDIYWADHDHGKYETGGKDVLIILLTHQGDMYL